MFVCGLEAAKLPPPAGQVYRLFTLTRPSGSIRQFSSILELEPGLITADLDSVSLQRRRGGETRTRLLTLALVSFNDPFKRDPGTIAVISLT